MSLSLSICSLKKLSMVHVVWQHDSPHSVAHLAGRLVVLLDLPFSLTDVLGCGANLLPDLIGLVFVVRVLQLPQLFADSDLMTVVRLDPHHRALLRTNSVYLQLLE